MEHAEKLRRVQSEERRKRVSFERRLKHESLNLLKKHRDELSRRLEEESKKNRELAVQALKRANDMENSLRFSSPRTSRSTHLYPSLSPNNNQIQVLRPLPSIEDRHFRRKPQPQQPSSRDPGFENFARWEWNPVRPPGQTCPFGNMSS